MPNAVGVRNFEGEVGGEDQAFPEGVDDVLLLAPAEICSNVVDGDERTGVSLVESVASWRVGCTPQPGGYAHAAG